MSFKKILHSSFLMGGAQVVILACAFIRSKLVAVLLGPAGIGINGLLNGFSGNLFALAGWGLGTSGVRSIAAASEHEKASKFSAVKNFGKSLSLIGLALTLVLFLPAAYFTFGDLNYSVEILIVGLGVPCLILTTVFTVVLQANGQTKSIAKIQIITAVISLVLGLPLIYFFKTIGIALALFIAALVPLLAAWKFSKPYRPQPAPVNSEDLTKLKKLGAAIMATAFIYQLSAYIIRCLLVDRLGLPAAGFYQAAWAISGALPGFIFTAMGTDFFPRVAAAENENEARSLSENQILAALLLALPILAGILTMGKEVIHLLYSSRFNESIPLLCWMTWAIFLRLVAWPLSYWLVARGSSKIIVTLDCINNILLVVVTLGLLPIFGLLGTAIAAVVCQLIYLFIMLIVVKKRSGSWLSFKTMKAVLVMAFVLFLAQFSTSIFTGNYFGIIPTIVISVICAGVYFYIIHHTSIPKKQ